MLDKLEKLLDVWIQVGEGMLVNKVISLKDQVSEAPEGLLKVIKKAKPKAKAKVEAPAVTEVKHVIVPEGKSLAEAIKVAQLFVKKNDLDAAKVIVAKFKVDTIPEMDHAQRIEFMNIMLGELKMDLVA